MERTGFCEPAVEGDVVADAIRRIREAEAQAEEIGRRAGAERKKLVAEAQDAAERLLALLAADRAIESDAGNVQLHQLFVLVSHQCQERGDHQHRLGQHQRGDLVAGGLPEPGRDRARRAVRPGAGRG